MSPDILLVCPRTSFRDVLGVNVMERVWYSPGGRGRGVSSFGAKSRGMMCIDGFYFLIEKQNMSVIWFIISGGQCTDEADIFLETFLSQNQAGSQLFASKLVFLLNSCWISVSVLFLVSGRQLRRDVETFGIIFSPEKGNGAKDWTTDEGIKWYIPVGSGKFR